MAAAKQRLSAIDPDALSRRQKDVCETIAGGPRGAVRGPFAVLLHQPDVADRVQALGRALRFEGM